MARYYKQDATGNNDGTSVADAWTDLQTAFDSTTYALGPLYLCQRADTADITLSAQVDLDTNSGDAASYQRLRLIGANAAGVVNGSRIVFTGGGGNYHLFATTSGAVRLSFENIELKNVNATKYLLSIGASCTHGRCVNCLFTGPGAYAVYGGASSSYWTFWDCEANSVTSGWSFPATSAPWRFFNCRGIGCGGYVYAASGLGLWHGCVAHGSTGVSGGGWNIGMHGCNLINCVGDGNAQSAVVIGNTVYGVVIVGSRFTNNGVYGIKGYNPYYGTEIVACSFLNNGSGPTDYVTELLAGPTITTDGFKDRAGHDFSLLSNAVGRSTLYTGYGTPAIYGPSGLPTRERPMVIWPSMIGA